MLTDRWMMGMVAGLSLAIAATTLAKGRDDGGDDEQRRETPRFSFALWGDMPYADIERAQQIPALIADINRSDVAFTVFDGDIKSGSTACTDNVYTEAIDRFNTFDGPMIYVPGDNEWTDCHRTNNGGYNNLERLEHLRQTMFASAKSFGRRPMKIGHQGEPGQPYAENTRWSAGNVFFLTLNIPGSNNNKVDSDASCTKKSVRTTQDCSADNAEYAARNAANFAYLRDTFARARAGRAAGLVIVIQADPVFDLPETEDVNERSATPEVDGYDGFLAALVAETQTFNGQVMLVHGDTHFFKFDKPLLDQADLIPNFSRLETFGSPNVHWVKVSVNPSVRGLFVVEPMIVKGN
jgi:hypothetical protein